MQGRHHGRDGAGGDTGDQVTAGSEYRSLRLHREADRLAITLNRPERRNALTHEMMVELGQALAAARGDRALRVVVLRGAGGHFCAGGDLDAMAEMPPPPAPGEADPLYASYRYFGDVLERLNELPQAVVAVVEGFAVGGGLGLACCADVVIVHAQAKLGLPEPKWGFIPSQILPFVVRRIGEAEARRIAVMGEVVDGREAKRLGVAHYVCEDEAAIEIRIAEVLAALRKCAPDAVAAVKRLVLSVAARSDREVMDDAAASLVALLRRPEAREGMAAFAAKRRPRWAE